MENIIICINCNLIYNAESVCACNEYLKSPGICTKCNRILYECYCQHPTIGQIILNEPIVHDEKKTKTDDKKCILCQLVDIEDCNLSCANRHTYCRYCANILSFLQLNTCLKCTSKISVPIFLPDLISRKCRTANSNLCQICNTHFYSGGWCNCVGKLNVYNVPICLRCDRALYCYIHERISSTCEVCRSLCTCTLSIIGKFLFFNTNAQQLEHAYEQNITHLPARTIGRPLGFTRIKAKVGMITPQLKNFPAMPYKCPICLTHKTTYDICINLHRVCKLCNTLLRATSSKCPVCRCESKPGQSIKCTLDRKIIWNITQANLYTRLDDYRQYINAVENHR
jgi:hypothetical protein